MGRRDSASVRTEQPPLGTFKWIDVSHRAHSACALNVDGEAVCWGSAAHEGVLPGPFEQIGTGDDMTCALDAGGYASCWGPWESAPQDWITPYSGAPLQDLSVNGYACGRTAVSIECWGVSSGTLGDTYTNMPRGVLLGVQVAEVRCVWTDDEFGCNDGTQVPLATREVVPVPYASSGRGAMVLQTDGSVLRIQSNVWRRHEAGPFMDISGSPERGCGIGEDGFVTCWEETEGQDLTLSPP